MNSVDVIEQKNYYMYKRFIMRGSATKHEYR